MKTYRLSVRPKPSKVLEIVVKEAQKGLPEDMAPVELQTTARLVLFFCNYV
jgi:hypothetical protein